VLLMDSFGELARLYRLASVAFIGGSLVPSGGHNPIEAAAVGTPVAFGPHMSNFRDVAATFLDSGAAREVKDAGELEQFVITMAQDSAARQEMARRALDVVERNRGAAERNAQRLVELLG
jgi:3-deoxy-D-manno-octulosonic-acid transferase